MGEMINKGLVIVMVLLTVALVPWRAQAEIKIGGLMLSDEVRYGDALQGFKEVLNKAGYGEPKTIITVENAEGNKARTVELVQKLSAAKPDLIFTLGTTATIAVSRAIANVPIVFCLVYDPVAAGIAQAWKSSGNNTTGTSSKIPMGRLINMAQHITPVKKLAVLYTPGEKNSEASLQDLQNIQTQYKFKVIPVRLARIEDVQQLLPEVLRSVDAVYVTGSHLFDSQVTVIADMAIRAKVPTITHLDDLVEKGVLMGVCADPYVLGQDAGLKAVKILKGAKPSSIPINIPEKTAVILNMKTAQKGQFQLPADFLNRVTKRIE